MNRYSVSKATLGRLPGYLQYLRNLQERKEEDEEEQTKGKEQEEEKEEDKKERLCTVLYNLIEGIRICGNMLYPFIPESAEKIMEQITHPDNAEKIAVGEWNAAAEFGYKYAEGSKVNPAPTPLFMRIDEKEFNARLEADRLAAEEAAKKAAEEQEARELEEQEQRFREQQAMRLRHRAMRLRTEQELESLSY